MKLLIAGSRTLDPNPSRIDAAFDELIFVRRDVSLVVSGCARGADRAGERWAMSMGVEIARYPILDEDVARYGAKRAPKVRNARMAEIADMALVFWDGESGGSCDMVTRMVLRDKPVRVIGMRK